MASASLAPGLQVRHRHPAREHRRHKGHTQTLAAPGAAATEPGTPPVFRPSDAQGVHESAKDPSDRIAVKLAAPDGDKNKGTGPRLTKPAHEISPEGLCRRLLAWSAPESGTFCHRDGGHGRGAHRRRRVLKLPTLPYGK
jgi:hypothetical protein